MTETISFSFALSFLFKTFGDRSLTLRRCMEPNHQAPIQDGSQALQGACKMSQNGPMTLQNAANKVPNVQKIPSKGVIDVCRFEA